MRRWKPISATSSQSFPDRAGFFLPRINPPLSPPRAGPFVFLSGSAGTEGQQMRSWDWLSKTRLGDLLVTGIVVTTAFGVCGFVMTFFAIGLEYLRGH